MIRPDEVTSIGVFLKPHGIKGEIMADLDLDAEEVTSLSCIVCDIEGILVPFFINAARPKGSDAVLLLIDGVTDEKMAAEFAGKQVFALASEVSDDTDGGDIIYLADTAGFTILDTEGKAIATIESFDDSTPNHLFIARSSDGKEILVPAAEDLIEAIDLTGRTITMSLPKGLY